MAKYSTTYVFVNLTLGTGLKCIKVLMQQQQKSRGQKVLLWQMFRWQMFGGWG